MDLSTAEWRRASRSKEDGSNCVEVSSGTGVVSVRDSKAPCLGRLTFTTGTFAEFVAQVKRGELDS